MLVIGIDAATWKVIKPDLRKLINLKKLMEEGKHKTIKVKEKPHSASVWCSIFSGKSEKEHGHENFTVGGKIKRREDIDVEFIWDVLDREGYDVKALNIPFVVPPYNFNCEFKSAGFGLPITAEEWEEELIEVTKKSKEILKERPNFFAVVFTILDRIQHLHWGESLVLKWYKKIDERVGDIIQFAKDDKIIVLSDHGFCRWEEVKKHTLKKTKEIKGDHCPEAILITKNVEYEIKRPEDIFFAIREEV